MHGHYLWLISHLDPGGGDSRDDERTLHLAEADRLRRLNRRQARDQEQAARLRRRADLFLTRAKALEHTPGCAEASTG